MLVMLYKVLLTIIHPSKVSLLGVGALGMLYSTLFTHGDRGLPTTALILANIGLWTTVSKCARSREIYKVVWIALQHSLSVCATTLAFWCAYCIACKLSAHIIIRDGVVPRYFDFVEVTC